jgi:acyl carrier protein
MNTIGDFIDFLNDELGLPLTVDEASASLDQLDGWDSLHVLTILVALERRTGRRISLPDALEASTLQEIYWLAVRP